ncbi:glycosyltransferase family 2 protein [Salegentibacter sp. BDJ18]|uniref:glycosyltransferase family 2 protein n=1 Tax=Salegentibacter sp. BDJ18 TaxID=2816376 RepID=UPI001AAE99F2|nr:glycosyltransferase family 2 protein [Salegentibacter sp. BDJ18]MBO2544283.1 glycosyltransferase family 2 protein [Salegentibacter sp. BDJ18]
MNCLNILILNYNSSWETVELFKTLEAFNLRDTEITVIDNASIPKDRAYLKGQIPQENLILNEVNIGYAGGNNIGIQLAIERNFEFVLLINPDIRLDKECISSLLKTIEKDEKVGVIGPRICYRKDPDLIFSDGGFVLEKKGYAAPHINYNKRINETTNPGVHEVDYVSGSCFMLSTKVVEAVGKLREDFFLYYEETEWCLRIRKYNKKCVVDSNVVAFLSPSIKNNNYHFYMTRNRLLLSRIERKNIFSTHKILLNTVLQEILRKLVKGKRPSSPTIAKAKGILFSFVINIKTS